jgi:hypothetical protein
MSFKLVSSCQFPEEKCLQISCISHLCFMSNLTYTSAFDYHIGICNLKRLIILDYRERASDSIESLRESFLKWFETGVLIVERVKCLLLQ